MTTGWKILAALLLAAAAVWAWDAKTASDIAKGDKQGYARAKAETKDAELKAIQEVRKEEGRRIAALQGVIDESKKDLEGARAAAAAASDAGQRLRNQLAALRRRGSGANPAVASRGAPRPVDGAAFDLLIGLFGGADHLAGELAAALDRSRTAGLACQRSYETLTH